MFLCNLIRRRTGKTSFSCIFEKNVYLQCVETPKQTSMKKTLLLSGLLAPLCIGFGQVSVPPIENLEINVTSNDSVLLDWDIPVNATEAVISWSDMIEYTAYGMAAAQCATDQAARFDTDDLTDFVGWRVKEVSVILSYTDTVYGTQDQHYYIRIWKGTDNALEQVYEKEILYPEYSVPLTNSVDSVIYVEDDRGLWIGYYIDKYRSYPWVVDNRQYVEKGFCIRLYHRNYPETDCLVDNIWYHNDSYPFGTLCIAATLSSSDLHDTNNVDNGSLTGYRVYRNGELIKEIPYSFMTHFTDTEFTREANVEYCVTAMYGEEESEPVCVTATITSIGDTATNDDIIILPNPTNGLILIEGATVSEVLVYNTIGQLVKTVGNTNEIDMGHLPEGIYFLRITAKDGRLQIKKVTVGK